MFDRVIRSPGTPYVVSFLVSALAALAVCYLSSPWNWRTADLDRDLAFANEKLAGF